MTRRFLFGAVVALAIAVLPLGAGADTYSIVDLGLDGGTICDTTAAATKCVATTPPLAPTANFEYDPPLAGFDLASGTITLDTGTPALDLAFSIASATFLDTQGAFSGVDEVQFSNVSYSASGLTVTPLGGGVYSIPSQTGVTISGDYEQLLAGGTVVAQQPFNSTARVTGTCTVVGTTMTCGLFFGPGTTTLDINGTAQRFQHVFNVNTVIPEPSTALLLGLGCLGLFGLGRSRTP